MQCQAEYGADIPKRLKKLIQHSAHSKHALRKLEKVLTADKQFRSLIGTTQAVDIIQGACAVVWCWTVLNDMQVV